MSTNGRDTSVPAIAHDATAMAHAAIQASLAEDEQRLAECVHAMLAHPIRAALCMWALVHACQAMAAALASSMNTDPAEAWRVAKAIADDDPPATVAPVPAATSGSVRRGDADRR